MKPKRTIRLGGTGFQPVVLGILPKTGGLAHTVGGGRLENIRIRLATKIRRDAEFNRPEACSTPITA